MQKVELIHNSIKYSKFFEFIEEIIEDYYIFYMKSLLIIVKYYE